MPYVNINHIEINEKHLMIDYNIGTDLLFCSYINYSTIAAKLVRQALKPEFRAEAAKRGNSYVKITPWAEGKPQSTYAHQC